MIAVKRRTIDSVQSSPWCRWPPGGRLSWESTFAAHYVDDERSAQNIVFPAAAALEEEGSTDRLDYAGEAVNTGPEAEANASHIGGHLAAVADGATYAELDAPEQEAQATVDAARAAGPSDAIVAELQGQEDTIVGQRNTLFKGETARRLLLTALAWSTVGPRTGIAASAAFIRAGVMLILVVLGMRHHYKSAVVLA